MGIVAPIVCGGSVFGPCFVIQYFVSILARAEHTESPFRHTCMQTIQIQTRLRNGAVHLYKVQYTSHLVALITMPRLNYAYDKIYILLRCGSFYSYFFLLSFIFFKIYFNHAFKC